MSRIPERSNTIGQTQQLMPAGEAVPSVPPGSPRLTPTGTVSSFQCGQCGSEDIQRLSIVYESGTTQIETRTRGTSTGFGVARGGFGLGTAVNSSRTTGTQMSALAKRAAPPPRKFGAKWIGVGIVGGIVAMVVGGIILALIVIGLTVWAAQPGIRYNRNVHPGLHAAWEQSWLCHRCGAITPIQAQ